MHDTIPAPDYLVAEDGDWRWFVYSHDPDNLYVIDDPATLDHEPLWLRPERVSAVDPSERGDWEPVTRDSHGRFAPAYCWIECRESHPDARPFMGARYKPQRP